MPEFNVTPYDVEGVVDYNKLTRQFGTEKITPELLNRIKKHCGDVHYMLKRGVFFSHRDMNWLLNEYEKGNKFFLYTGRGPSESVHIGHLVPWVFTKWLQDKFDVPLYFQLTDDEKFLFKEKLSLEQTSSHALENALDIIALGFKKKKTFIFRDTKASGTLYPQAIQFAKKITYSTIKGAFGLQDSANIGQIWYTSMQAVPAVLESIRKKHNVPCLIPLGIDQDPHFRVARDVYPKLGYHKPALIHNKFIPGLAGVQGKMSASSEESTIYLKDTPEEVANKIKRYAFSGGKASLAEHRKLGGDTSIDVSYQWLEMMFEPDDKKLLKIKQDYESGKMLTSELKEILINNINAFLKQHQKNREKAKKQLSSFLWEGEKLRKHIEGK